MTGSLRCPCCDKELEDYENKYCSDCNSISLEDIEAFLEEIQQNEE